MKNQNTESQPELFAAPASLRPGAPVDYWRSPAVIAPNNFIYKSLSNWAFNPAVGCAHGCRFCYVPDASANKLAPMLEPYGVRDPDSQWGEYLLVRPWDECKFLASLRQAERTPPSALKSDGHRAVIYSSTTDPYQVFHHPNPERQRELSEHLRFVVRRSLELIRDHSTLNVRILTRSPLARADFDLFGSLGNRLAFGMSVPTLRHELARAYEPKAPAPSQRLATLREAKAAGLHVYVAMAATYPECDETDLRATLQALAALDPITIFHEPINIRAKNVERIQAQAEGLGVGLQTAVFATRESWQDYAVYALRTVQRLAQDLGVGQRLHLWPDATLGSAAALRRVEQAAEHLQWLEGWWHRISEWPA